MTLCRTSAGVLPLAVAAFALFGLNTLPASPCVAAEVLADKPSVVPRSSSFLADHSDDIRNKHDENARTHSGGTARWQPPSREELRAQVLAWLDQSKASAAIRRSVEAVWPSDGKSVDEPDRLERLAETFALVDPRAEKLLQLCSKPHTAEVLPRQDWLSDKRESPLVAANLRLFYGRWLARELLFDEAMEQLATLEPNEVADPATLLFYQAVACHRMLLREQGLRAIERLLEEGGPCPRRYSVVAQLMRADLQDLQEGTLDHIARRMDDIHRRLDLGRTGPKVRNQEKGVIESLDKLIKKLEDQQNQQQQQAAAGNSLAPSKPAEQSRIMGGKGPGEVAKRTIGNKSGWGNLPPKEREEAMQQIGREFPSHYREVVEQYFRRLANEPESSAEEKPNR
jgi:hypothetical protein